MARLNGLWSFALVAVLVLAGMRLLHVAAPIVYPPAGSGPFEVDTPMRAGELSGFAVWMPSYRPQRAGPDPRIVVTRLGASHVEIEWRGDRFLRLSESLGGGSLEPPAGAIRVDGEFGDVIWSRGAEWHALARRGEVTLHVETDLTRRDLERVLLTLYEVRPVSPRRS